MQRLSMRSGVFPSIIEKNSGSAGYIYGPTGLTSKRTTINQEFNIYYYHKDHLGSIRSVTDSSKNIITACTYHPFGEIEVEEGLEHYLFNGKEKDSTGLYYYGARYYDYEIGRFITRDTIMNNFLIPQSLNRYSYCRNNSLIYLDPDGKLEKKFAIVGSKSVHPYRIYNFAPFLQDPLGAPREEFANFATLLLNCSATTKKSLIRVEGILIKSYDSQMAESAKGTSLGWKGNVNITTIQIKCNDLIMETDISLSTDGEFEFEIYYMGENEQKITISLKITPISEGKVIIDFSFEVWAINEDVEITITFWPTTLSHLPTPEDSSNKEEFGISIPVSDTPIAI